MSGTVYGDCEEVCVGAYPFTTKKGCFTTKEELAGKIKVTEMAASMESMNN